MVDFAGKLRDLRVNRGYTQVQLAARLGVAESILSAYETQMRLPSLDMVIRIANEFGVTSDYLLGLEKQKTLDVDKLTDEQIAIVSSVIQEYQKLNKK